MVAAGLDAEGVFGVVHQRFGAHQLTRDRAADVDQVLADRLELEHLVERRVPYTSAGVAPTSSATWAHRVVGDVAVLLLARCTSGMVADVSWGTGR